MTPRDLEQWGVEWPAAHPDTREPFTNVDDFERRQDVQSVRFNAPNPPSRHVATAWETSIDDDGDEVETVTAWRELSDEEWAAALAAYDAALTRWKRTGGVYQSPGMVTFRGRFTTARGAYALGISDGKVWHWHETGD